LPVQRDRTRSHERAAFALLAEAVILQLHDDPDPERLVQLGELDVFERNTRFRERRLLRRLDAERPVARPRVPLATLMPETGAADEHRLALQRTRPLSARHDERRCAI